MWGNIFSGAMSLAQGDSPEEILKKQAMTTLMGGVAPPGVDSASTVAPHLAQTGAEQAIASGMGGELASTLGGEMVTQPQHLTNGLGQSSNPFTQFSRDAYQNVGQHVDSAFNNVTDTVGQGFDWLNDKTGLENKDYTMLAMNQGANLLQPTPQQPIQHASMEGISKPMGNTPPNQSGLLSSLPPMTPQDEQVLSQSNTLTPEQIMKLKQQGIL